MIDFDKFEVLTFDCYGTLIDWENGIFNSLNPILNNYNIDLERNKLLEDYAQFETKFELKDDFYKYKDILKNVLLEFGKKYKFSPSEKDLNDFSYSIKTWEPFEDTVESLQLMRTKFKLGIISNIDNDLFKFSEKKLNVRISYLTTAEEVKSYKPNHNNFFVSLDKIGVEKGKVLHIAQSLHHDILPANQLGLDSVWVNRRKGLEGTGATPKANAKPDLEVSSLRELVKLMDLKPRKTISAGGVVLNKNGEVLVVSQHGTSWSLPKGHIDDGEDLLTAAKREIYEEAGISDLELIKELGFYERCRIGKSGGNDMSELKTIHIYLYKTNQIDLKPIDPENPEAVWLDKNKVADLLTHEKDREFYLSIINDF